MNKGLKRITYWEFSPLPRKRVRYESRVTLSDRLAPLCVLFGMLLGTAYVGYFFDRLSSDFVVNAETLPVAESQEGETKKRQTTTPSSSTPEGERLDSETPHEEESPSVSKKQILDEIVEVFGDDAAEAITMIRKCENSKFDPKATNWNKNGTWDTGIFQVNQVHGYTLEEMQDYKKNIRAAKKIFDNRGWTAWSCSEVVGVKPFYKK